MENQKNTQNNLSEHPNVVAGSFGALELWSKPSSGVPEAADFTPEPRDLKGPKRTSVVSGFKRATESHKGAHAFSGVLKGQQGAPIPPRSRFVDYLFPCGGSR